MDQAGYGIAELCFFVADAVAAYYGASGFDHFGEAAGENALEDADVGLVGETDEGHRGERLPAHGVNVAERVGGGDLAEGVGVVDDGRKEVDRLYERLVGRELIHSGVVGVIEAN